MFDNEREKEQIWSRWIVKERKRERKRMIGGESEREESSSEGSYLMALHLETGRLKYIEQFSPETFSLPPRF